MIRHFVDAIHSLFTLDRAECVWQEEPGEAGSNTHSRVESHQQLRQAIAAYETPDKSESTGTVPGTGNQGARAWC